MPFLAGAGIKLGLFALAFAFVFTIGVDVGWSQKGRMEDARRAKEIQVTNNALRQSAMAVNEADSLLDGARGKADAALVRANRIIAERRDVNDRLARALGLLDRTASTDNIGLSSATGPASGYDGGSSNAELSRRVVELTTRLLEQADRNTEKLIQCQAFVIAERAAFQSFNQKIQQGNK